MKISYESLILLKETINLALKSSQSNMSISELYKLENQTKKLIQKTNDHIESLKTKNIILQKFHMTK